MFTLDDSIAPELFPLAWLAGHWRGQGMMSYPTVPQTPFHQDLTFTHDGGPYLAYQSTIWVPAAGSTVEAQASPFGHVTFEADPGVFTQLWAVESGYWRTVPADAEDKGGPTMTDGEGHAELEVMLAEPTGHASVLLGRVKGPRVDLVSDTIVRTFDAAPVQATRRMYGLVNSQLFWALDMEAFGEPMQSYMAGQLSRVEDE